MKINYKNKDLKITNKNRGFGCSSCEFATFNYDIRWCVLFCRSGKIWIKDIFYSDIFRV